ncbi:glycosyltransferase family 4 protein [Alkalihalophilus pseudofirmus]|uniref:glycosyltransferase family 4 protein n=1 Tax=Alkalihalophilus pseudofirmus TaxID=79885 RepID=UPI00259B777F|nr:glycosyltransferase family 4 protein [Alkalihalophilus pseudofirmus]WEG15363.1 glycosyltransferase family 4 protein [Alkalihalophilus pseudofirmus]
MNILYIVDRPPNLAGIQVTTSNRIKALRKNKINAEVIFFERGNAEYLFNDIPHYFIENKNQFYNHLSKKSYDIISYIYSLKYIDTIPKKFKGKIVFEIRGWSSSVTNVLEQIKKSNRVNAIICIANYIKPLVEKRVKNIPVYVDLNFVPDKFSSNNNETNDNIPIPKKGYKVIGYVGRVMSTKNWKEWVDICGLLNKDQNIELWVISNVATCEVYNRIDLLQNRCKELGIKKENIKIIPQIPNDLMPSLYLTIGKSGGCILSTSPSEGLGNHVLEPMACSCPVVSSNRPGKNEIINHSFNGLLYKLGDIDGAVEQLSNLLTNDSFRKKIIKNALKEIEEKYRSESYVKRFLEIISNIRS